MPSGSVSGRRLIGKIDGHGGKVGTRATRGGRLPLMQPCRRCFDERRPDVVVVEQLWLHRYIAAARAAGAFVVLDAHNVESSVYEQVAAAASDEQRDLDRLMASTHGSDRVSGDRCGRPGVGMQLR